MKKLIPLFLIFYSLAMSAQITMVQHGLSTSPAIVCINSVAKYDSILSDYNGIVILNSDFSVYKNITIPWPTAFQWRLKQVSTISQNFITTDGMICYIINGYDVNNTWHGYIYKEDGTQLTAINGGTLGIVNYIANGTVTSGIEVYHYSSPPTIDYYSTPGTYCNQCAVSACGAAGIMPAPGNNSGELLLSPNPSAREVNLTYHLPDGMNEGDISIFNALGQLVRKMHVTGTSGSLLDRSDASGVYEYQLSTAEGSVVKQQIFVH